MKRSGGDPPYADYKKGMKRLLDIYQKNVSEQCREDTAISDNKHICILCGHIWKAKTKDPKRCPSCSSSRWNSSELIKHICRKCSHGWMSKINDPIMCPRCKSKLWNKDMSSCICERCGNRWNYVKGKIPKRCPSCSSAKINDNSITSHKCRSGANIRTRSCRTAISVTGTVIDSNIKQKWTDPDQVQNIESILGSDNDDSRKMFELTNDSMLNYKEAEILVRFFNEKDPIKVAITSGVSFYKVVMLTDPFFEKVVGEGE